MATLSYSPSPRRDRRARAAEIERIGAEVIGPGQVVAMLPGAIHR